MPLYRGSRRLILRCGSNPIPGPAAITFLARTSGLTTRERNAYINLINGLVADGTWTLFDALYVFATNNTTTANLNLVSSSFGLTQTGALTFTPDVGYTGNGSTGYLTSALTPASGGNYVQNSGSFGAYIQSNVTVADSSVVLGAAVAGNFAYLSPMNSGAVFTFNVNDGSFTGIANTTSMGAWIASRTTSSRIDLYKNGNTTPFGTNASSTSVPPTTTPWALFALSQNGGGTITNFTTQQASIFFFGAGVTSAQSATINNRFNDFMRAVSSNNVY